MQSLSSEDTKKNFKRLIRYATPYKLGFVASIIGMLGYAGVDMLFLSQIKPLIDEGLTGQDPDFMKWAPLFVILCFTFRGISHFLANYCLAWVGNNVVADIRKQLFEHILKMPVSFHDQESTGRLISKLTFDTEQVLNAVSKALITLIQQGVYVFGLIALMFYYSWKLSLIFLLVIPVIGLVITIVSKRFRKVSKSIQGAMGQVTSTAEQTFNGHKVVLTFDGHEREVERFNQINKNNRQQRMKLIATKSASVPVIQIIASFALAFILYIVTQDSMSDIEPGAFIAIITYMTLLMNPLKQLTNVNSEFQRGMAAAASVFSVLDQDLEKDNGNTPLGKSKGNLSFEHVNFSYSDDENLALKDISFEAKPGETIALVGRSGSGKSTASSMLLRFYDPQTGLIKIDGTTIDQFSLKDLRRQFAYVSQQVVLFNDSIADNIAYGKPEATRDEIITVAKNAHVWEFVKDLPDGLDTNIGENGAMLSGGQRQRIAIARALLCDAPFLILDEATSALDTESERHIQDALQLLQKDRTSIVIAHRLSTIESADKIIVMEQGEIIEEGSHSDLIEKNGAYAQLHQFQFGE